METRRNDDEEDHARHRGRDGSDGSDGKYRMVIESYYQQMASSRGAFLSASRLQLSHAGLAALLAAVLWFHGGGGDATWMACLSLLHAGLTLYGRRALKGNADGGIRAYVVLASVLAAACIASGVYATWRTSVGAGLDALLRVHAPLGLALLGTTAALTSAMHARRFVRAHASMQASRAAKKTHPAT